MATLLVVRSSLPRWPSGISCRRPGQCFVHAAPVLVLQTFTCTVCAHGCVGALDEMVAFSVYRFVYAWLSASRVGVGPKERAYVCVCVCALD